MQHEKLPWELEEEILSLIPPKPLARFRSVCKRWNALFNDKRFINKHLVRARPHFILLSESKICSVEVNLDGPSIEMHTLPSDIPDYRHTTPLRIEYCEGLLVYTTRTGFGICNPWLRRIKWTKSRVFCCNNNGMGYDNSRDANHYKVLRSQANHPIIKANVIEVRSNAWKSYEFVPSNWNITSSYCSISLNGTLYWVALCHVSYEHFIQSFDFSIESFKPYCRLPAGKNDPYDIRALGVFKGDRFSILEQDHKTGDMEIWVTKEKIKSGDGDAVEWIKFMSVLVPIWSTLIPSIYPASYFIDEKSCSLVLCSFNKELNTCIFIAKGDQFHELLINELVRYETRHRTYYPSLVPIPTGANDEVTFKVKPQEFGSHYALPNGVEASYRVGGNEWDDSFYDNAKKISVGQIHFGVVFVKFEYYKDNMVVAGAAHGNATHISEDLLIADDDYIEVVEGTYIASNITSLTFRLHKGNISRQYGVRNGKPFVLGGGKHSKIIGFYGKSSDVYLTALGVHISTSV